MDHLGGHSIQRGDIKLIACSNNTYGMSKSQEILVNDWDEKYSMPIVKGLVAWLWSRVITFSSDPC